MTDKEVIKYLRKQSNMWEKNCQIVGNKYLKLYAKYTKLKNRKDNMKKKELDGYYIDGKGNIFELYKDEDGKVSQKKMKNTSFIITEKKKYKK